MRLLDFNANFTAAFYTVNILALLIVTTVTKRLVKRDRPPMPDYSNESTPNRRTFDVRSNETNYSLPSGDSA